MKKLFTEYEVMIGSVFFILVLTFFVGSIFSREIRIFSMALVGFAFVIGAWFFVIKFITKKLNERNNGVDLK